MKLKNLTVDLRSWNKLLVFSMISMIVAFTITSCSKAAPTETKSEANKPSNTATTNTANETKPASSALAGTYEVSGTGVDGKSYDGELVVTKRDSVNQMSWKVGTEAYDGVAVQSGNTVAAAYTTGTDGKGCGAVVYKVSPDGSLDGTWGEWGVNQSGTEKAVQEGEMKGGVGTFNVTGTNPNGSAYKGKLTITEGPNDVYQFAWSTGTNYIGTGVKMGDYIAAGSGAKQCGFVIYDVKGDTLNGKWGFPGSTALGTEKATKK
jgi:hypothetical protein